MLEVRCVEAEPVGIQQFINYCKSRGADKVTIESTANGNLFVTLEKRANSDGWSQWFKAKFVVPMTENGQINVFEEATNKLEELKNACEKWEKSFSEDKNDGQIEDKQAD